MTSEALTASQYRISAVNGQLEENASLGWRRPVSLLTRGKREQEASSPSLFEEFSCSNKQESSLVVCYVFLTLTRLLMTLPILKSCLLGSRPCHVFSESMNTIQIRPPKVEGARVMTFPDRISSKESPIVGSVQVTTLLVHGLLTPSQNTAEHLSMKLTELFSRRQRDSTGELARRSQIQDKKTSKRVSEVDAHNALQQT